MSKPPLDAQEREQLCDLFAELGPDAPTLCEGWTTEDLAAHLVVRERDLRSIPGILVGGAFGGYFARVTDGLMEGAKKKLGWGALVDKVRSGPPFGPLRVPGLREQFNLPEYFIHHEDVRRANGREPRTGPAVAELEEALWGLLRRTARLQVRHVPRGVGVDLVRPDRPSSPLHARAAGDGGTATITGRPGEITLYLSGRKGAAEVTLTGDPAAVAALEQSRLGI